MTAKIFVTDTHPLVWYATEKFTKLSKKVKLAFDDAVSGQATIYVPSVVLWELSLLVTAGKVRLAASLDELVAEHFYAQAIYPLHLEEKDILIAHSLRFSKDMFDKLIVASALRLELPLITNDAQLHATKPCLLYW
jgi:PIN domain nuclease of toxin-antitoxin system